MDLPRRLGRLALALVASAFAAPSLAAQLLHLDPAARIEVRKLEFEGVSDAVDVTDLRTSIYTEATRCRSFVLTPFCRFTNYRGFEERNYLDRKELQRDVLRIRVYYYKHGFREAQVDTAVTSVGENAVAVRFDIQEGPATVVSDVRVVVDSGVLSAKKLEQLTLIKVGQPLDLFVLDSTRVNFQNEMWELGFADALVDTSTVVDAVARTARFQLRVVSNHVTTVGSIVITGADKVSSSTVLNSLSFRPGDLFRRSKMIESQRNLYESNLFKLAALDIPETFDSLKTVNVLLREAPMHEARVGGGFNTVDFVQTEGRFTHYNLFGGARRLDVSATVGNLLAGSLNGQGIFHRQLVDSSITGDAGDFLSPTWQLSIEARQPAWLRRPRNALSVGAFAQRRSVPSVVIDRGYGGNVTYTRSLALRAPASLSYRFEVTRVDAGGPYFCVNFGVCDTTTIGALRANQRLSPILAQVQVDRSDQPLNPMRGYTARAELEHASGFTISDYRYNRAYAEGALYARMGGKSGVLASHLKLGFVRPLEGGGTVGQAVLHPRKRFYAGGSQSVRGYGENQLGPRILTLPRQFLANAKDASGAPCDINSDAIRFCNPNGLLDTANKPIGDENFTPRALGGTSVIEASVEYRFLLPFMENLGGALFIDGAAVGEKVLDPLGSTVQSLADLVKGTGAITPGFGIRYYSDVGPIRIDVGFNPSRAENLAVVTELTRNGRPEIIALTTPKRLAPAGSGVRGVLDRFILHLSIGQAF